MPSSCWRPSPDCSVVQTTGSQRGQYDPPPLKELHKISKGPQENNRKLGVMINLERVTETSLTE